MSGRDLSSLLDRAARHGVSSFVHLSIRGLPDTDAQALRELAARYSLTMATHLRSLADLASLGEILDEAEVPWLVFKGPFLSEFVYSRPDLRYYGDVDVLVPPSAFQRALTALEQRGLSVLDQDASVGRSMAGQVHLRLRLGTTADLHWHVLNRSFVRRSLSISTEQLFERARTVVLAGRQVRTLDAVDTLVHLCVHGGLSGGVRLVWLKDIEQCLTTDAPPWDEVIERARQWRAAALTALVLGRVGRTFDLEIPHEVLTDLAPSVLRRRSNAALDRLWPPERADGANSPAGLSAQFARDDFRSTVSVVVHRLGVRAVSIARGTLRQRRLRRPVS